jgi:hypothetical protein
LKHQPCPFRARRRSSSWLRDFRGPQSGALERGRAIPRGRASASAPTQTRQAKPRVTKPADRPSPHDCTDCRCAPGGPSRRDSTAIITLIVVLAASGCAAQHTIVDTAGARSVPANVAFASLGPGTPGVLSVIESRYANATRQTIALVTHGRTPGENQLQIDVFGVTNEGVALDTTLPDLPLNDAGLYSEAQEALPDVQLHTSLNYMQNRYGPFGYAVGLSRGMLKREERRCSP